jgi:NADP-dependent 3-hydroxy acid dehydrogenase YdfG
MALREREKLSGTTLVWFWPALSTVPKRAAPRCVVITGASGGLGAGLARAYAGPDMVLGLTGRDPVRLAAVAEWCRARGSRVEAAALDVGDAAAMAKFLSDLWSICPVDLVIANAGVSAGTRPDGTLEGLEAATWVVRTNLLGALNTVEPLLPRMLARGRGHVAMVASVAGYRGLPDSPAYCAAKAGVRLYGESLRAALTPRGLAVSVIVPGFFASAMSDRYLGAQPFRISLDTAVLRVRRGLDAQRSRIVFPRRLGLLLQLADLLPAVIGDRILRLARFRIAAERPREAR